MTRFARPDGVLFVHAVTGQRILALIFAVAVPLSATACNEKALETIAGSVDGGHRATSALTPEQASKIVAQVGDHTITLGDYVAALEHMDQFDRLRYQSPERRKELLKEMIDLELLANEATAKGYDKDPLAQQELRAVLRDAMLQDARKGAQSPNDIPDADLHAYYDAHRDEYRDPERRRISVIVAKDEKSANDALAQAKKAATATQWGEVVRAKSIDPQAKANVPVDLAGDIGMVSPPGDPRGENSKVPEVVRVAAFELAKIGDVYARAVNADGKYYVVRLTQKTESHDRAFSEAERSIRVKLAQDRIRAREDALLASLRAEFPVQIDDAVLATVKVDVADAAADLAPTDDHADGGAPATTVDAGKKHR